MGKYRITIELDLDFEPIFKEIPEGLFAKETETLEDKVYYEKETICNAVNNSYLYALMKDMDDLAKDKENGLYPYLKPHNKCLIQVSKQLTENLKLEKL